MNRNIKINNDDLNIYEATKNLYMVNETILQNRINSKIEEQNLDDNYGISNSSAFSHFGINPGQMPKSVLSSNPTDIENELFGMHKLNGKYQLKKRKYDFTPRVNKLESVQFFERPEYTYIPEPLVVEKNQRPMIP